MVRAFMSCPECREIIRLWSAKAHRFRLSMHTVIELGGQLTLRQRRYVQRLYRVEWQHNDPAEYGLEDHWDGETE